jgi:UDP-N-acetylmuramate--alanine ligase
LRKDIKKVHFIGIGGYGMSALARVLLHLGYLVTGSDLKQSEITENLALLGARVFIGHSADNISGAQLVVYSTAISENNVEMQATRQAGLPMWHRSELLAHFLNGRYGIAVAGAHGKTTTTSMLALVLTHGGLDPTAFIGGVLADFHGNARVGNSDYLVAEACESDHSFLRYHPSIAVVTNIEPDHLEHYNGDFNQLLAAYRAFLENIKPDGCAVLFADDNYLDTMYPAHIRKVVTYGHASTADYQATDHEIIGWGTRFTVKQAGQVLGRITLNIPGIHNVENALAALAVARQLEIPFNKIKSGLEEFHGAKRRFQFLLQKNGIAVVDDYAHHPTEVKATLKAARYGNPGRIIAVFQPHRYTRTQAFMDEFAHAFDGADKTFIHRIYSAGETPIQGVSSAELATRLRGRGVDTVQMDDADELAAQILETVRPGDLVITMGAGDITEIGHKIAARLREKGNGQ